MDDRPETHHVSCSFTVSELLGLRLAVADRLTLLRSKNATYPGSTSVAHGEVAPPEAVASLHVFTDHTDMYYGAEKLANAFERYRFYKRGYLRVRLYINIYENQQACENEEWIIEDCLLGAEDYPS